MNKKRTPPALTHHDVRIMKEILLPIHRELAAINRRLARLEKVKAEQAVNTGRLVNVNNPDYGE